MSYIGVMSHMNRPVFFLVLDLVLYSFMVLMFVLPWIWIQVSKMRSTAVRKMNPDSWRAMVAFKYIDGEDSSRSLLSRIWMILIKQSVTMSWQQYHIYTAIRYAFAVYLVLIIAGPFVWGPQGMYQQSDMMFIYLGAASLTWGVVLFASYQIGDGQIVAIPEVLEVWPFCAWFGLFNLMTWTSLCVYCDRAIKWREYVITCVKYHV